MQQPIVITPPDVTLVSLDEIKEHLRVDHSDDDAKLQALLWAAQGEFAGPDGWTGRAFSEQEIELRLDGFPPCAFNLLWATESADILLPCPPLLLDDDHPLSVAYTDAAGDEQVVAEDLYSIVTGGASGRARIALNYGETWPLPRWQEDAVRIRYFAGYAGDDVRAEPIKAAIKLHVGMLYDGEDEAKARAAITNLLAPFRVY